MKKHKRKIIVISILIFVLSIGFIPLKSVRNDGGTVEYSAFFYRYVKWHKMNPSYLDDKSEMEYLKGNSLYLFPNNFIRPEYED